MHSSKINWNKILVSLIFVVGLLGVFNLVLYFYLSQEETAREGRSIDSTAIESNESTLGVNINSDQKCQDDELADRLKWWNERYKYNREIIVNNSERSTVTFDHSSLVSQSKSRADGNDLKIILKDRDKFFEISNFPTELNTPSAQISFNSNSDGEYYLYYGNLQEESVANSSQIDLGDPATLSDETEYPININIDRKWALKGIESEKPTIAVEIDPSLNIAYPAINYEILGTEIGSAVLPEDTSYRQEVEIGELTTGTYEIQASLTNECYTIMSTKEPLFVSYPLFVIWSLDWEGYSVNQNYLELIEDILDTYQIPATQFVNPRTFTTNSIRENDKDRLLEWIKRREQVGDEIGLHIHLWTDFVSQAGITPKTSPNWANLNNGYDVMFSNYSYEESKRIIEFGLQILEEKGFEDIVSFRAGGWEMDDENFKALQSSGIKLDSSGRTNHSLGTNLIPSAWNLEPTTKPYRPSSENINTSEGELVFDIWEFPNNGADSYAYEAEELISRFDQNFNGEMLQQPQALTYLSHPEWFNEDYPRILSLYDYMSNYKYESDLGPVVYVTLADALKYWNENELP